MIQATQLRRGNTILMNGELYQVVDYQHITLGNCAPPREIEIFAGESFDIRRAAGFSATVSGDRPLSGFHRAQAGSFREI